MDECVCVWGGGKREAGVRGGMGFGATAPCRLRHHRFHTERFHTERFHTERFHTERFHTERTGRVCSGYLTYLGTVWHIASH